MLTRRLGLFGELEDFHGAHVAIRQSLNLKGFERRDAIPEPQPYCLPGGAEMRSDRRFSGEMPGDKFVGRVHGDYDALRKTYPSSFSEHPCPTGQSKICPMIWSEIADRLDTAFQAVKAAKAWSWAKLAAEMKTTKTTLKSWTKGQHFPSKKHWKHIERVTAITVEDFILGEDRAAKVHQLRDSFCTEPDEVSLLRAFRNISPEGRIYLLKAAEFALQQYPPDHHIVRFQPPNKNPKP